MEILKHENAFLGETVYEAKHASGMPVFVVNKPGFYKKYAIFGTRYGSIDSHFISPGDSEITHVPDGIAHYLEHKMFEEPDRNIFDDFSKQGASANAFTSFDMTAYLFSCTEHFEENLSTLLHYVQNPYFTDENVEKERGIIGQEIRMYDDHPYWRVMFNYLELLYHKHPVRLDIAGTVESISHITKELLYQCYHTFYHLSNMALFVIGDIDVEKTFEKIFAELKPQEYPGEIKRIYPEEPSSVAGKLREISLPVSMPMMMTGYKDTDLSTDGKTNMKKQLEVGMLLELLFGRSSEFYETYYNAGLINDSFSYEYEIGNGYAHTEIYAETPQPKELYQHMMDRVKQAKADGLKKADFDRVKKAMWGGFVMGLDNEENFAGNFLSWVFRGSNLLDFDAIYRSITFDDIKNRLKTHFNEEQSALSIVNTQ